MGGVYPAAVEAAAARLFPLFLVQRLPGSPAGGGARRAAARTASSERRPAQAGLGEEGIASRTGRLVPRGLAPQEVFFPPASPWVAGGGAGGAAHRTGRAVEPRALLAQPVATRPLPDVLGGDAAAAQAAWIVVVDVGVGRMPRALACLHAPSPPPDRGFGRRPV